MRSILMTFAPMLVAAACGASPPQPHDSSVAEHERAAREQDAAAASWTPLDEGTVESHREAAAQHRAASRGLTDVEAQACAGLAADDRDISPFEHKADIASVEPFVKTTYGNKAGPIAHQVGAVVTFRAVRGMTAEWLQRVIDCHMARNAALGHVAPEMPDCPLVPRGVEAHVRSTGRGFAVEIESSDPDAAREILTRAQRLIAPPPTP